MIFTFTSESVSEGHPDKICDQISDAVLDEAIKIYREPKVGCESLVSEDFVLVSGEIGPEEVLNKLHIDEIVRNTVENIGYTYNGLGFHYNNIKIEERLKLQSENITIQVNQSKKEKIGAGDHGMMFGYATNQGEQAGLKNINLMPVPIMIAHRLVGKYTDVRRKNILKNVYPDGKALVTIEYKNKIPHKLVNISMAIHHHYNYDLKTLKADVIDLIIEPVLNELGIFEAGFITIKIMEKAKDEESEFICVNKNGKFEIGGPKADCGLTGRKIMVDTYGAWGRHGGGAFSGKDPTKVDRSAAYMARYIAKNVVSAGISDNCEIYLAYRIGDSEPVSFDIRIDNINSLKINVNLIKKAIRNIFPLNVHGIIEILNLKKPIFKKTASYGHFGRNDYDFTWEMTDKVDELKNQLHL